MNHLDIALHPALRNVPEIEAASSEKIFVNVEYENKNYGILKYKRITYFEVIYEGKI